MYLHAFVTTALQKSNFKLETKILKIKWEMYDYLYERKIQFYGSEKIKHKNKNGFVSYLTLAVVINKKFE